MNKITNKEKISSTEGNIMVRIDKKTIESLELHLVLQQISDYCITQLGKDEALSITPFEDVSTILPELHRVKEFTAAFDSGSKIPNHGFDSVERALHLLSIENSTLEITGIRRILSISQTTQTLLKFFKKFEEFYIYLNSFSEKVIYTPVLAEEINKKIDKHGDVKDNATNELSIIRNRLKHVKGQINSSFSKALNHYAQKDYLDEIRETIVDNRRVLAVKAMYRKKIKGTVLGNSKTGSLVYMEPQETLEYANELSNLIFEEQEEIKRILKELTEYIRPHSALLKTYQDYLINIDLFYAKARYSIKINGALPIITSERRLSLKNAYHPTLLVANNKLKQKTFPQTISLHLENRIIIISGPNAGGKSITLKTVGLLQVMLQSGILIPVDPLSEFCFFNRILTDIGDNQSIENQLSTYSYRLKKMNQFLKKCKAETLFLIDEFGTGSDPELGGALAETFLEVFYERKAFGVITTHYTNLKLLANELPHATNANMQFNNRSLEPMYQLILGEAGSSFTFEVAQKNGIPYNLVNKAKKKIERGKIRFDKSIADLQKERFQLRKTSEALKTEEQKAREENKQMTDTNVRIQEKLENYQELFDSNMRLISLGKKLDSLSKQYYNNKKKRLLMDELFKMVLVENSKIKKISPTEKKKEKVKKYIVKKEVEKKVQVIRTRKKKQKEIAKKAPPPKPRVDLKIGDRVRMIDGIAEGTIDAIEKKRAIVNYGTFTTQVNMTELEKV